MKRKVVICGAGNYPRGSANANYTQYLSDALIAAGYDVTIICETNRAFTDQKEFLYHGARVIDLWNRSGCHLFRRVMNGKLFKMRFFLTMMRLGLSKNDLAITCADQVIAKPVFTAKKIKKFKSCGYILEWFPQTMFSDPKRGERYEQGIQKCRDHELLWPISHFIADGFADANLKMQILPPMTDVSEYGYLPKKQGKYQIILPANGAMKDALQEMLLGVAGLPDEKLAEIVFHITGVAEEKAQLMLGEENWQRVRPCLVFHSWMEYEELVELYQKCHFLLLARDINQMTLANFPSKVPEVMTYGIVPVVSRVGDYTKYYLEDGINSLIFDGYTAEQCTATLHRALSIPFQAYVELSQNARKCAEERFDYHSWVPVLQEGIESIF